MIHCNNCNSEHMVSEAFCRSMNAPIASHEKWIREHPDGKEHRAAPRNAGLIGGHGKPSTGLLERHQEPITLRDFTKPRPIVMPPVEPLATDRQVSYIRDLLNSHMCPDDARERLIFSLGLPSTGEGRTITKTKASASIDWLKRQPYAPKPLVAEPTFDVPDGYYALDSISGKNETVFYRVNTSNGRTYVSIQVSDNFTTVSRDKANSVLGRIERAGVKDAMIRYGQAIGKCGHCHRTLTDDASRAAGIGPICASKF